VDFEAIVDSAISPFAVIDDTGTIVWVSSSITELNGWLPSELVGTNMLDRLDEPSKIAVIDSYARFLEASAGGPEWLGTGILLQTIAKDGSLVPCIASSATQARTGIPGMVIQLVRAAPQTHLQQAVAAMAAGEAIPTVVTHIARMVASEIAGADVEIAWAWDGRVFESAAGSRIALLGHDDGGPGGRPWADALGGAVPDR
jgi:PAS domain S-box-containing protein